MLRRFAILLPILILTACAPSGGNARVDPQLAAEIAKIQAIDNHAHPVRPVLAGEKPDDEYDALPVEALEPQSDPVRDRPGSPELLDAHRKIFDGDKAGAARTYGQDYAVRVLDQLNIETMLANRVAVGPGLPAPRFLWVPFADALMYPLPTAAIAHNPDQKAFFADEDRLLKRYYTESGVTSKPATLDEYLNKVVRATLERHHSAGARSPKNSRWRTSALWTSATPPKPMPKKPTPPAKATTKLFRTTFSVSSPPSAAAWAWPFTSTPRPAEADISTSPAATRCCWSRCSTIRPCAKPIS